MDLPFDFEKPEDSPGFLLWQTTITWQRLIKRGLETFDISHSEFVIMALLLWFKAHHFEATQVLIANWSMLDKMTVSKSLKRLSAQEYVTRREHAKDTRAKHVSLTEKGMKLIIQIVPIVEHIDAQFFAKLDTHETELFKKILAKLL